MLAVAWHLPTMRQSRPGAKIDLTLVAMDPAHAGKGLGPALYWLVLQECARMGFSAAQTRIVARNLPALNILSRLGFSFRSAVTSMHCYSATATTDVGIL